MGNSIKVEAGNALQVPSGSSGYGALPVPALWTPLELVSLAGWYDASDASTITDSGGSVSQWSDKSDNNYHITQGTGSKQPTTGTKTINSLNVLDFDGANGTLERVYTEELSRINTGVFVVCAADVDNNDYRCPVSSRNYSRGYFFYAAFDDTWHANTGDGSYKTIFGPAVVLSQAQILEAIFDNGDMEFFMEGNSKGSVLGGEANTANPFVVGSTGNTTSGSFHFAGRIAEVIIVGAAMSTGDRQLVEGYLAWKWGLEAELPGGHPYENAAPTV